MRTTTDALAYHMKSPLLGFQIMPWKKLDSYTPCTVHSIVFDVSHHKIGYGF